MNAPDAGSESRPRSGGLVDSLRRMLATLISIVQTRIELFTTEIEEEIQAAVRILAWVLAAMFLAGLAVLMLAITVMIVFWDDHRILAASLVTVAFAGLAAAMATVARRRFRERPRLLSASLDELRRDRAALEDRLP